MPDLYEIVTAFRTAIEAALRAGEIIEMCSFPRGWWTRQIESVKEINDELRSISEAEVEDSFYRQIIMWNGLSLRQSIPTSHPVALDEMTRDEFDAKMARGIAQAKAGEGISADEFFDSLKREIMKSDV